MKVCMLAYAHYINDARIKAYVRTLKDNGHQVDVVALRSEGEAAVEGDPSGSVFRIMDKYQGDRKILYGMSYLAFFIKAFFFLARRTLHSRYDVVHVHNMPNMLVFSALVPRLFGARLLLDVHDLMTVNYMAKFSASESDFPVQMLKWEQRMSSMFVDHVCCADDNQRDYLAEHCSVPREKITVLMNLPNPQLFGQTPTCEKTQDGAFRIVYHGTIAHRLGIDLILRAVSKAAETVPVELWMYGAGDFLPNALELASELGIEDRVHFSRSFFPVEQIPEIVTGMDLGIIGNRRNLACDKYMLPVKLLEYVYLGVPVIAPRLEVIKRYFDESMIRYYAPENVEEMAEAIVDLYGNAAERSRLAQAATDFYRVHNIQVQAKTYLELMSSSRVRPMRVARTQS